VKSLNLFAKEKLSPQALGREFAGLVRQDVKRLRDAGRVSGPATVWVDGRMGVPLETVKVPGSIVYRFNGIAAALEWALSYCMERSPVLSGRYKKSWVIIVDGRVWNAPLRDVPVGSTVWITNPQPYHRAIDMGAQGSGKAGREIADRKGVSKKRRGAYVSITDACRVELKRRFPGVEASRVFVELTGPPPAPYRGGKGMAGSMVGGKRLAKQNMRSSAFRAGRKFLAPRFSKTGEPMTYPAVEVRWGA
jgi:hypothetical protein